MSLLCKINLFLKIQCSPSIVFEMFAAKKADFTFQIKIFQCVMK